MHYTYVTALLFTAVAVGCGGSSGVGATCASGAACDSDLYCKVPAGELTGTCEEVPSECGRSVCGDDACDAALQEACGTTSTNCLIVLNEGTVRCGDARPAAALGETCSVIAQCVEGTYCDIKDIGDVGTCTALPAECGGVATCDCLQSAVDACPDGYGCSIINDQGYVACHD